MKSISIYLGETLTSINFLECYHSLLLLIFQSENLKIYLLKINTDVELRILKAIQYNFEL